MDLLEEVHPLLAEFLQFGAVGRGSESGEHALSVESFQKVFGFVCRFRRRV